jgi:hypothetical protein
VRTLTILDFLRTSFGEDFETQDENVTSGCVLCLYFMDLNESRGLDIYIYIHIHA